MTAVAEPAFHAPLFDADAFAQRLQPAVARAGGVRAAAAASKIAAATISRACNGWPSLSHENYLRLSAWIDGQKETA